jgi:hypothetical protein
MADSLKKGMPSSRNRQARGGGGDNTKKVMVILFLLLCCAGSFYFYWTTTKMIEADVWAIESAKNASSQPDPATTAEKQEIDDAEAGLSSITSSASQAMRLAMLAETSGKYPLDLAVTLVSSPSTASLAPPVEEIMPPVVNVLAIMITDSDKVAMINVDGGSSLVVRQGSKFSDGRARITKIEAKGVTYRWMGKNIQVSVE